MWTDLLSVLSEARLTDQIAHRQECLCHAAAERLQTIARGGSEANTPRKRSRRRNRAASAAPGRVARPVLLPLTRQKSWHIHERGVSLRSTPCYPLTPLRGKRLLPRIRVDDPLDRLSAHAAKTNLVAREHDAIDLRPIESARLVCCAFECANFPGKFLSAE